MSDKKITKMVPILRESLELTESEAKAIVPIFLGGNMTAGGISLLVGDNLSTVKRTLVRLIKKGLVKEIDGKVPVYRAVSPNLALKEQLKGFEKISLYPGPVSADGPGRSLPFL